MGVAIIDNFNVVFQQFLNSRIDALRLEFDSNTQWNLSKSIDELLLQVKPTLDQHTRIEISEKIQDLVLDYQQDILKKVYVDAFVDGLNFEVRLKEI